MNIKNEPIEKAEGAALTDDALDKVEGGVGGGRKTECPYCGELVRYVHQHIKLNHPEVHKA